MLTCFVCNIPSAQHRISGPSVLSARPLLWCGTPFAPSGLVDGGPPIVSLPTALCFVFDFSLFRSLIVLYLFAKLNDCLFLAYLFLFMNAARARLFACLFINLHTFRIGNLFSWIQPGARPSALDAPSSVALVLGLCRRQTIAWSLRHSTAVVGLSFRWSAAPAQAHSLRPLRVRPFAFKASTATSSADIGSGPTTDALPFRRLPTFGHSGARLVQRLASSFLVLWCVVNVVFALPFALCINAHTWSEPAPRCFRV